MSDNVNREPLEEQEPLPARGTKVGGLAGHPVERIEVYENGRWRALTEDDVVIWTDGTS